MIAEAATTGELLGAMALGAVIGLVYISGVLLYVFTRKEDDL